jgi:Family of unknown function (DUF6263)
MFIFRLQLCCLVVLSCCGGCKQTKSDQDNLSFNPQSGVLYKLSLTGINERQWTYNDKLQHTVDSSQINYHFQLLRKTDTLFLLKLTFQDFRIYQNMYAVNTSVENTTRAAIQTNPLLLWNYLLHFAKAKYVTVWMNKKGHVVQVNGIERLIDSISVLSGIENPTVNSYLRDFISEPAIKDELNRLFCFVPGKPKSSGQSWVETIVLVGKAPVKWSTDFTLQTVKNDTAVISCQSFISARQGGETGRTYMKGNMAGSITACYSQGIPCGWNAQIETVTSTDNYDITTRQQFTATITVQKQ